MVNLVVTSLAGGVLIGLASGVLVLLNGRVAGVSGALHRAVRQPRDLEGVAFLIGLFAAGLAARFLIGAHAAPALSAEPLALLAVGGLLVGAGTRLGAGCTSGHGVCGLANLSLRSLVATLLFMAVAIGVVFVTRRAGLGHAFGGLVQ
jgi:uncharacterized membrane protein YedE/YeeE